MLRLFVPLRKRVVQKVVHPFVQVRKGFIADVPLVPLNLNKYIYTCVRIPYLLDGVKHPNHDVSQVYRIPPI